jgi:hypothetical protein
MKGARVSSSETMSLPAMADQFDQNDLSQTFELETEF